MIRKGKKGQTQLKGSLAVPLILMVILLGVVFYTVSVTREERSKLIPKVTYRSLLDETPGILKVDLEHIKITPEPYSLGTVVVDNSPVTRGEAIQSNFAVSHSAVTEDVIDFNFSVTNKEILKEINLNFNILRVTGNGILTISLNDIIIFSDPVAERSNINIPMPANTLNLGQNNLKIRVSGPGLAFWNKNSYVCSDLYLLYKEYSSKAASVDQTLIISKTDLQKIKTAEVQTYINKISNLPANLKLAVNDELVYDNQLTVNENLVINVPLEAFHSGVNTFTWSTERDGSFEVRNAYLVVGKSDEEIGRVVKNYEFSFPDELLSSIRNYDCRLKITKTSDEKNSNVIRVILNDHTLILAFSQNKIDTSVCKYLKKGMNEIYISTNDYLDIASLKVDITSII